MTVSPTAVQAGFNMLQVGAIRMPFLFASCNAAMLTGELALRGVSSVLKGVGFNGESELSARVTNVIDRIRPYKNREEWTIQRLALHAIACAAIGSLGVSLVSWAFGPAPAIYNNVLSWLGPIRVSNEVHPAVAVISSLIGRVTSW